MKLLNLDPEMFVKMVVVGLFWNNSRWSTVDHILKIFVEMKVITIWHIEFLIQNKRNGFLHQKRLLRYTGIRYGDLFIENKQSLLYVRDHKSAHGHKINMLRLVSHKQVEISKIGRLKAIDWEREFIELGVTPKMFSVAVDEINLRLETNQFSSAVASSIYREKIETKFSDTD